MSASTAQSWTRRMRPDYYDSMRVSDAERAEVADLLGRHYSDGRLDKQEFDERVSRAMNAKTRGDLNGLFDDLPPVENPAGTKDRDGGHDREGRDGRAGPGGLAAGPYRPGRRLRGRGHPVLLIIAAIVLASVVWNAMMHILFVPWIAIMAFVAVVVLLNRRRRRLSLAGGDGPRVPCAPGR